MYEINMLYILKEIGNFDEWIRRVLKCLGMWDFCGFGKILVDSKWGGKDI